MVLSSGKEDSPHVHVSSLGDTMLPNSDGGYVYLLRSLVFPEEVYIGCTENILFRVHEHNNGHGAQSVTRSDCIPWCVISFIGNLGHLTKRERELLKSQWEFRNNASIMRGSVSNIEQFVENGRLVTESYNETQTSPADAKYVDYTAK